MNTSSSPTLNPADAVDNLAAPGAGLPRREKSGLRWATAAAVAGLLALAALATPLLTPHERMADFSRDVVLEEALPRAFAGWRLDPNQGAAVVNPQQESLLKVLYSQTVARTYFNAQGQRVMLSIAYGGTQGGGLELHRPEVCYVAQGFSMEKQGVGALNFAGAAQPVPVQRLMSRQRGREEPISYWMRVGDDVMVSGLPQQLSRVRQGLRGLVPDGVLFRVSSISPDPAAAFALQDRFVQDLMAALPPRAQRLLIGPVSANRSGTAHE